MKISQIVSGARLFDMSYIKFDTDSKKSICMGNILEEIKKEQHELWVLRNTSYV